MALSKCISEIHAIAQTGLTYTNDAYDKERYLRLLDIAADMTASAANIGSEAVKAIFEIDKGYATPKLDVRAFILKDGEIVLVKERQKNLWTLPGGWVDVGESPADAVIREVKEESGYDVKVVRLLALWDKLKHDHPLQWPHVIKCFFLCDIKGGEPIENLEIAEIGTFKLDNLPPLSTHLVTYTQLQKLHGLIEKRLPASYD